MEALSTKTLELAPESPGTPSVPRLFYGNYAYYLEKTEREGLEGKENTVDENKTKNLPESGSSTPGPSTPPSDAARTDLTEPARPLSNPPFILVKAGQSRPQTSGERREAEKQKQAAVRRLKRQEEEILKELESLEAEKIRLETEIQKPEIYSSGEKARTIQRRLSELEAGITEKTRAWETKAAELRDAADPC
jgi:ATP-binding cassette subfamily F protein 3